jgi:hypothetical protein
MTNDNDLIRRGDAMNAVPEHWRPTMSSRIAALPAVAASQPADPVTNADRRQRVVVKPLVWENHPMGWIAAPPTGQAYIIDVRIKGRVMFIKGMNPPPKFSDLEAAKAAAQADYEARILAAIDVQPDHTVPDILARVSLADLEGYGSTTQPDPRDAQIAALVEVIQANLMFAEKIAGALDVDIDETRLNVRVVPEGREVASKSWAEVMQEARAALAAVKGGDA